VGAVASPRGRWGSRRLARDLSEGAASSCLLSTTVVVRELYVAYSDNIGQSLGASGATRTSPASGQWSAWSPARDARRGGESRGHAMGPTAPRRFERCQ